ncbi:SDR family NAD(P)-dependent oxidoreductase [Streptomyces rimosus]|uniref:SDR family NAD(P)-dependent oxidoreductase n=1 Tax=Streptomyces rimosus TaxID=1927 RepID=UPI0004CB7CCD|nr:SDR family NAD(P)-dependent oxidoreductase [Streptomyces rimosus]
MTHRAETYEKTFAGHEPLIAQHRAADTGLLPAAVQLEMAMAGLARPGTGSPPELTDVTFHRPLTIADDATAAVRLDVTHAPDDQAPDDRFELSTMVAGERRRLSTGRGRPLSRSSAPASVPQVTGTHPVTPDDLYESWSRAGLRYGPDFRTVRELTAGEGVARAVLRSDAEPMPWLAHPLLTDGVFQVVSCALQDLAGAGGPQPMLPIGVARIAVYADLSALASGATVLARRTGVEGAYSTADAVVLGPTGEVAAEFDGVRMRRTTAVAEPAGQLLPLVSRIRWRPAPGPGREPAQGTWVVLHHGDTLGELTSRQLRSEGARVVEAHLGTPGEHPARSRDRLVLTHADEDGFRRLWEAVGDPVAGVVHLWNATEATDDRAEEGELGTGLHGCFAALKTLGERQRKSRFLVMTRHAQPVADDDTPVPARAALWGLVRTAAIEYPGLRPRLVDLDDTPGALTAELGDGPTEVAYRHGVRHEPVRSPERRTGPAHRAVRPGGRYLVLGGHGGLGLEVAGRFAAEGAGLVALVSRRGAAGADGARLAEAGAAGCTVVSYAADVTVPGQLRDVVVRIRAEHGKLHGVVHAAGTLKDGLIRSTTIEDVTAVIRPKADGVRELAAAVAGTDLDFAVLFASVSGTFGNLGQGGYAAANAYLDAFAHTRGAPWLSVDWGLWGEVGMGTAVADQLRRRGVRPLGTAEALDALIGVLGGDARQVVIAHPDGTETGPQTGPERDGPERDGPERDGPGDVHAVAGRERVADELENFLAERLGVTPFDRRVPLADYGMSSIMSVELSEELSRRWDLHLPATLFLEHGDFADLAQALTDRYGAAGAVRAPAARAPREPVAPDAPEAREPEPAPAAPPRRPDTGPRTDVAVVAISGDLPGAPDVTGLWPLLRAGRHAFTEIPAERWDIDTYFEARGPHMTGTYCRIGAFLDDIHRFDPSFFGISVREAGEMDAQQKLLLEHAWSVRDESGLAGRRDIGVFVGATYTHHRDARGLDTVGPHTALGSLNAVLANRISYALDLTGPSQTVDTLCSSSLVAVQHAVAALRAGTCAAAIVAGCHVGLTPWYYRSLSQLGALSTTRPRPFDDRADGFVPGEGAVAVMLKPLADAERDGDRIWGVIRGAAVNHGGRGSALPVPRGEAQAAVIRAALADAGAAPADLSLIESHGTATRLGDPIEIAALTEVFGADPGRRAPLHLGSVKANVGHLEPAAGLAGLVKVLLCLRHGEIPPLAGFETPGAHLDLTGVPFVIPTEPLPWHSDGPRRAGISAFGMGGTNAHIVVEEYPAAPYAPDTSVPAGLDEHLLLLSAHTPRDLVRRAADLERLLRAEPSAVGALCRSAAVGRDHLRYRVAVLGSTADALLAGLTRAAGRAGEAAGTVLRDGAVLEHGARTAGTALAARLARFTPHTPERLADQLRAPDDRLSTGLAFFHVGGGTVDWSQVYEGTPARRITLPPYPFRAAPPRAHAPEAEDADDPADIVHRLSRAHRVFAEETLPGALPLAVALRTTGVLRRVEFVSRGTGLHALTSDLDDPARTGPVTFRFGDRIVARLETGRADEAADATAGDHDIDALRAELDRTLEPTGLYAWFAAKGMDLSAPLCSLAEIRFGPARVLARLDAPDGGRLESAVVALDAALQSMAVLTLADPAAASATYLPVSIGRVLRRDDPGRTAYVLFDADGTTPDGVRRGHATLLSADGRVLARLEDVAYRAVTGEGVPVAAEEPGQDVRRPAVSTPPPAGEADTVASVVAVVRTVLHDPGVTPTTPLSSAGLDSMLATAVAAAIEEAHGVRLSPTDVLDAADCRALAVRVAGETGAEPAGAERPDGPGRTITPAEPSPTPAEPAAAAAPGPEDMAVIGFALALPGARNPAELWSLLTRGDTRIGPAPAHRWGSYAQDGATDTGGFLDNIEEFDARFFDFFPKQAEVLDPQARWLLRTTWEALESAGLPPRRVPPATGVFVGASYQHYRDYNIAAELDTHSGLGNHNAFLANRLSHFLDLRGPSMTVDTLCSSSLVALHTAVRSIRDGECEQAVVAGVRVAMSPLHYVAMRNLRALSPSGRSRPFDAAADGFVPGEGVVSVVVKPLAAALRDGNRVRGVIRGSAVNHGGRTSGLTVPSARAQGDVVLAALENAGIPPETIGLLEAHGTGTGLGDPIEVEGVSRAWRGRTARAQFCAIGSLKSNVGHLEPAAGLAGLVKCLLAMEYGVVPPTLHVTRPNDHIRFEDVIVEEPPAVPDRVQAAAGSHLVRVTGADEAAVRALATAYADHFETARDDWAAADLCHTANVGRAALEFQTAVSGGDAAELTAALRAIAAGSVPIARSDSGLTAEQILGAPVPAGTPHDHAAVVELVRAGYAHIDWAALSAPGARIADLPTYPFAAQKHWHTHETGVPAAPVAAAPATAVIDGGPAAETVVRHHPEALRVQWRESELPPSSSQLFHASVRIITADPALRNALTAALRDRGAAVAEDGPGADTIIAVGSPGPQADEPSGLSAFWAELREHVSALPAHGMLIRALHHGVAVHAAEREQLRPEAAAMAMAVRATCAESRKRSAVIDLDPADATEARARQLAAEYTALLHRADGDPAADVPSDTFAAYRNGVRYVPTMTAAAPGPSYEPSAAGYYLVTGGLGAVGRHLVRRLVDRGARHVGVVGRSVLDEARSVLLREASGQAELRYVPCDVSDAAALAAAAREFGARWGRLLGVVHCSGGANPFGAMHRRRWDDAARVIAPKAAGSLNAVRLARTQGADFAVLVSSIAGTQPRAGRGLVDYSLANAYQLALAERENGGPTTVTAHAWPNWTGTGMEADASYSAAHSLDADEAADAFLDHVRSGGAVVFPGSAPAPPERTAMPSATSGVATRIRTVIHAPATGSRDHEVMRGHVRDAFVHVLGEDPGDRPIQALGLDSLVIAELTTALERRGGLDVDPSLLMRARTADDIAAGLAAAAPGRTAAPAEEAPPVRPAPADERVPALSALLRPLLTRDRDQDR